GFADGREVRVRATAEDGRVVEFRTIVRIDTPQEVLYYRHGGILPGVLRQRLRGRERPLAVPAAVEAAPPPGPGRGTAAVGATRPHTEPGATPGDLRHFLASVLYNRRRELDFRLAIGWTPHAGIMRITGLEPQRRRTDRLNLFIDGEFHCAVAVEVALRYGLRSGETIEPATLEEVLRENLAWEVRDSALRLLAVRARSESELRARL